MLASQLSCSVVIPTYNAEDFLDDALAALAGGRSLGLVLGSGFEGAPDLMARIAARHRLLGAAPETVAILKDPFGLAALCARLAIPHPAVTTGPVEEPERYLLKRVGGSGGSPSGVTHDDRSKSMNSSAFSCGDRSALAQSVGTTGSKSTCS